VYQKCKTWEEAIQFVEDCQANQKVPATPTQAEEWYVVWNVERKVVGVYQGWLDASKQFNGVSGARVKTFHDLQMAIREAAEHQKTFDFQSKTADPPNQDGGHSGSDSLGGKGGYHDGMRPPDVLYGPDPSKSEDELFEIDVGQGENEL
jgi:hypothetical protein